MSRELKPCGTTAAYKRHRRHGEEPCDECREAENSRQREGRPKRVLLPCGTAAAYARHLAHGEAADALCLKAHAAATRKRKARAGARRKQRAERSEAAS